MVDGLSDEQKRWKESIQVYNEEYTKLPGDTLLAAAFLAYSGPFTSFYRNKLLNEVWLPSVKRFNIPLSAEFDFCTFLVNPAIIQQWNFQKLPSDRFSTENGVLAIKGSRWPLLVDPQN